MILRLAEREDEHKQQRNEKHPYLKARSLAEAFAHFDNVDDLGYQCKDTRGDAEPKHDRFRKLHELEQNLCDPYNDLDDEPSVAHADNTVGYKNVVKRDQRLPALFPRLAEYLPL